jgi:hypothetical protein
MRPVFSNYFINVVTDDLMIMSDHIYRIIVIAGADLCVRPDGTGIDNDGAHIGAPHPRTHHPQ